MSGQIRYSDEFKVDAVAQVTERGYSVKEVAERLGISTKSLYTWISKFSKPQRVTDQEAEVRRLKKELARVTEERDILKKAAAYFAKDARLSMKWSHFLGQVCSVSKVYRV